jgi:hypothetical protein
MDWKKTALIAGLTTLIVAAAPAGYAQATASSTLTGFTYTLIDLDPNDGISPNLTLSNPNAWIAAAAYPSGSGSPEPGDILYQPGTASIATGYTNASSSYDGITASSALTLTGPAPDGQAPYIASTTIMQWNFVLTPNTAAVLMGYGSVQADPVDNFVTGAYNQLFAAYLAAPSDQYEAYFSDTLNTYYTNNTSRILSVTFSSGASELNGRVGIMSDAYAQALAAPVPEPATYAMLVGGLVALAYAKRRNRA